MTSICTSTSSGPMANGPEVTAVIRAWQAGEPFSENRLFETLYRSLRGKAQQCLRSERKSQSLSPTVLVHEAYLAMSKSKNIVVNDSDHFVRLAGRMMRNFIIDRARARKAAIHGGGMQRVEWKDTLVRSEDDADRVLAVAGALEKLEKQYPVLARLVEMRFFSGLTEAEIAALTGVATRTVRRQWKVAVTRLSDLLLRNTPAFRSLAATGANVPGLLVSPPATGGLSRSSAHNGHAPHGICGRVSGSLEPRSAACALKG